MARSILALALLGMLVFASAERTLLASRVKYGSGSTEAIALTTPFSVNGNTASPLNSPWATDLGYFVTTGNGTWSQAAANQAYATANLGPYTTVSATGVNTVTGGQFSGLLADRLYQGLQAVAFPSKMLGVAVGQNNAGYQTILAQSLLVGSAASAAAAGIVLASGPQLAGNVLCPNVIFTTDVATTWLAASAFGPSPAGSCGASVTGCSTATTTSFPSAQTFASQIVSVANAPATLILTANPGLSSYIPAITARTPYALGPDLVGITCTSRVLCFAVGGYTASTITYTAAAAGPPAVVASTVFARPTGYTYGQIMTSTNGGTMWNYAPVPANIPSSFCSSSALATGQQCPVPGLTGIGADSSGRHLYAVGWTALNGNVAAGDATTAGNVLVAAAQPYSTPGAGFIMYSGNSGASWVVQSAPILPGTIYVYSGVSVPRGTIAIAVGGQPIFSQVYQAGVMSASAAPGSVTATTGPAGIVSATFNGGFSWLNMPITANFINGVACQSSNPQKTYTCIVVSDRYQAQLTTFNATTVSSVLLGTQLGANVQPAFSWTSLSLPAQTSTSGPTTVVAGTTRATGIGAHLLGVVFDNPQVGWIFGYSTILRTSNGGKTWFSEAPFQVASMPSGSGGQAVFSVVPVPTSY